MKRTSSRQLFEGYRQHPLAPKTASDEAPPSVQRARRAHQRTRSSVQLIAQFLGLLGEHRLRIAYALLSLTVATLLALIPPAATKFVVDYVLGGKPLPPEFAFLYLPTDPWHLLLAVVGTVVAVSLLKIAFHISGRWSATLAVKRVQMSLRKRLFEHAIRLPLNRVHELKSGGVASVLREDAGSVGDLIFGMLYNPWRAVVQLLGSLVILAWVDWRLLVGALVLLPLLFITHRTWINRIRPIYRDVRAQRERVDGQATELFAGIRVVRAFSRQRAETSRYMQSNHLMGRQELFVWWWTRIVEIVWEALIPLGSAALLLYGGLQVLEKNLTLGDLMMFLVYLLMLLEPLAVLAQSATQFQNSLSGLDRVLDVLDEPREMSSGTTSKLVSIDRTTVAGQVTFEAVRFQYPEADRPALEEISLDVQPGETIALVGPSGAGKTTFCNLVARFYDPDEGRILLDGRDLREINVESYRNLLGVVEQDVFLFDGTVAENIGYATRSATMDEVSQAARIANADGFIEALPKGYETVIGERGVKLSGGQRQRIAIARAVLADPKILILDEATSNLDTESERLIQQSLETLITGRTSFIIAHRLSTIMHADRIVVLEDGRIREIGMHAELMQSDGRYSQMVQAQTAMQSNLIAT